MKRKQFLLLIIVGLLIIGSNKLYAQGIYPDRNERPGSFSESNLRTGEDEGDTGILNPGLGGSLFMPVMINGSMRNVGTMVFDTIDIHIKGGGFLKNMSENGNDARMVIKGGGMILYTDNTADGMFLSENGTNSLTLDTDPSSIRVRKTFTSGTQYAFSPPFSVRAGDISYPDIEKTISQTNQNGDVGAFDSVYIKTYASQKRADEGYGYGDPWEFVKSYDDIMQANEGYVIYTRRKGTAVIDFPANNLDSVKKAFRCADKTIAVKDYRRKFNDYWFDELSNNRGWNYIGGYMASPFAAGAGTSNVDFSSVIWSRAIYCQNSGDISKAWENIALFDTDKVLSPYMAFFVQISINDGLGGEVSPSADLTFKAAGLSSFKAGTSTLRADNTASERFIRLNLSDQGKNTVDKSYILLKGQYSDGYQVGEDAIKMFNPNTLQLWSKLGEEDLFVNALSEEGEKEIPLGISVPSAGNYTFSLNDLSDLVHSATLLDKYNEQTIDVLSEDYSFHAQGPANITDRFVLFLKDAPISVDPAHLSSIIAYADHSILTVKNIDEGDFIQVVDITGRIVHSGVTSQTGVYTTPIAEKGVYIVTVKGKQNAVIKVLNK